jgi:Uma2 family endonuclease
MYPNPIGTRFRTMSIPIYSPALIVEVLSPSNTAVKLNRRRILAMSAGPEEFWIVDLEGRTVFVTNLSCARTYAAGEAIQLKIFGGTIGVDDIFAV